MKLISILLGLILISCSDLIDERHFEIDARLSPYVNNFYKEAKKNGANIQSDYLIAVIDNQPTEVNGSSDKNSTIPTIHIDKNFFDTNNYVSDDSIGIYSIQYVVFHELGHALLYREHVYDHESIMVPGGTGFMMNEYYSSASVRSILNKELFKP